MTGQATDVYNTCNSIGAFRNTYRVPRVPLKGSIRATIRAILRISYSGAPDYKYSIIYPNSAC